MNETKFSCFREANILSTHLHPAQLLTHGKHICKKQCLISELLACLVPEEQS